MQIKNDIGTNEENFIEDKDELLILDNVTLRELKSKLIKGSIMYANSEAIDSLLQEAGEDKRPIVDLINGDTNILFGRRVLLIEDGFMGEEMKGFVFQSRVAIG